MSFNTTATTSNSGSAGLPLSSRRGSVSAPDPFAQNQNSVPPKGQTSRLTIIRVPPSPERSSSMTTESQDEDVASSQSSVSVSAALRSGGNRRGGSEGAGGRRKRMSFARSSFSPGVKPVISGGLATDPGSSRSRSSSSASESVFTANLGAKYNPPLSTRGGSTFRARPATLSPKQICDLAQTSLKVATVEGTSETIPRSSEGTNSLLFPSRDSISSESDPRDSSGDPSVSPASFTSLPESHYLPFVDRPSEVTALLTSDVNSRFVALLKQTFPSHLRDSFGILDEVDPVDWPFRSLMSYIAECPRSKHADKIWVTNIRRCIRARSEVVWERFKDVLGVPPELDVDLPVEGDGKETSTENPEFQDEEEEAWVEPIYPASPPLVPVAISPVVSSFSVDIGDGELGYRSRGHGMETIGEGEEEDNVAAVTNTLENKTPPRDHASEPSTEYINALRLYTPMSFSGDLPMSPEPGTSPPSTRSNTKTHPVRSIPEVCATPPVFGDLGPSVSTGISRRFSTSIPEFERGPVNPLFPSHFGRLSVGPTLSPNDSMRRRRDSLIPSVHSSRRYTVPGARSEDYVDRDPRGGDCAVTVTSDSDKGPAAAVEHELLQV